MRQAIKTLSFDDCAIKFAGPGDKAGVFEGYASIFGNVDHHNDIIMPGAFKGALALPRPAMFFNHARYDVPIGKWTHLEEDSKGLFAIGELTPGIPLAETVLLAMRHGTVDGMSVGFQYDESGFTHNEAGGLTFTAVKRLREISIVTEPANDRARVDAIKNLDGLEILTVRDAEDALRDAGFSKKQAAAFLAVCKQAIRRDSEATTIEALVAQIKSFDPLKTP